MEPFKSKKKKQPELEIRTKIINYLKDRGWFTIITHGSMYQAGLPDIFAVHKIHGHRWIEVKNPTSYKFTIAQQQAFPYFDDSGHGAYQTGVWVLVDNSQAEYEKLFRQPNWASYLPINQRIYGKPLTFGILTEMLKKEPE